MNKPWGRRWRLTTQVLTLLEELGSTPEEIATTLSRQRIVGVPHSVNECVVARYLNAVVASDRRVGTVSVDRTVVRLDGVHWWSSTARITIPWPVRWFITMFDNGSYPQLVGAAPRRVSGFGKSVSGLKASEAHPVDWSATDG